MHNCRSTRQHWLQKKEITRNRSDNESLSFRSITKIAAIHNPHTTQKMTNTRKQVVCRVVDRSDADRPEHWDLKMQKTGGNHSHTISTCFSQIMANLKWKQNTIVYSCLNCLKPNQSSLFEQSYVPSIQAPLWRWSQSESRLAVMFCF